MRTTIPKLRRAIRRTILEAYTKDGNMNVYTNMAMMSYYEDAILGEMGAFTGGINAYDLASHIGDLMAAPNDYFPPNEMSYEEQFFDNQTYDSALAKLEEEGKIVMTRMESRGPHFELA